MSEVTIPVGCSIYNTFRGFGVITRILCQSAPYPIIEIQYENSPFNSRITIDHLEEDVETGAVLLFNKILSDKERLEILLRHE